MTERLTAKSDRDLWVVRWSTGEIEIIEAIYFGGGKPAMGIFENPRHLLTIPKGTEFAILIERPGSIGVSAQIRQDKVG